jgi:hypothetical protein
MPYATAACGMIGKRLTAGLMIIGLGLAVGSCSAFSGVVADHWPHWAGGMPNDVPPRPGQPGYDEFVAHKQLDNGAAAPAAAAAETNPPAVAGASPQAAASGTPAPSNAAAAAGGLY